MKIPRLLWLALFVLCSMDAFALTTEDIAGIYVGRRIQMVPGPGGDMEVFDEVAVYWPNGAYSIWLQAQDGLVYGLDGYVSFNSDGTWSDSNGPKYRATFHGNTIVAFVDWRTVGQPGVVHSAVHRVDTLPDSFQHSPH